MLLLLFYTPNVELNGAFTRPVEAVGRNEFERFVISDLHFNHSTNRPIKPSNETVAKSDVDGKRNGLIFPFNATTALKIDKAAVTTVKNTTNSGLSGFSAT